MELHCSKLNFHVDCACDSILKAIDNNSDNGDFYSMCVEVHEEFGSKCKQTHINTHHKTQFSLYSKAFIIFFILRARISIHGIELAKMKI